MTPISIDAVCTAAGTDTDTGNEVGDTAYRHWTRLMVWNFTVLPEPLSCATVPPAISSRYIETQCLCPCQPAHA